MKKVFTHLVLAFIVVTQVGCSVRAFTWNDSSDVSRVYDTSLVEVYSDQEVVDE